MRSTEVGQRPTNTPLKFWGDSFIVMEFIELHVGCSVKLCETFHWLRAYN